MDIKTAQARLGHSDPRLTLAVYAQAMTEQDRDAARRLGELFMPAGSAVAGEAGDARRERAVNAPWATPRPAPADKPSAVTSADVVDVLISLSNPSKAFVRASKQVGGDESVDDPALAGPVYSPTPRLTNVQRREIVERYQLGERAFELCQAFDVHRATIARVLVETGVRRPRLMTDDERAEAVVLYGNGWTCSQIGVQLNRSRDAVRRALHGEGVRLRRSRFGVR